MIFYSTNDVYAAEELLQKNDLPFELVPTPLRQSVYCGVCVKTEESLEFIESLLQGFRYKLA